MYNYVFYVHFLAGTRCVAFFDMKHSTIRCSNCKYLVHIEFPANEQLCCDMCRHYRSTLWALVGKSEGQKRTSDSTHPSSHTPFQSLTTPEKAGRYQREHTFRRSCQRQIDRLLPRSSEKGGFNEDKSLCDDLSQIMVQNTELIKHTYPEGSFAQVFWGSQKQAASDRCPTDALASNDGQMVPLPSASVQQCVWNPARRWCCKAPISENSERLYASHQGCRWLLERCRWRA